MTKAKKSRNRGHAERASARKGRSRPSRGRKRPEAQSEPSEVHVAQNLPSYEAREYGLYWNKRTARDGVEPVRLTNFRARIVAETVHDDGVEKTRNFEVEVKLRGHCLSAIVPAAEFDSMRWLHREIGAHAILYPGPTRRQHVAVAIQSLSPNIKKKTVYGHTGWRHIDGQWVYLSHGTAIGAKGVLSEVVTDLKLDQLRCYSLCEPDPQAVRKCLALLEVAPPRVTVPLFAAVWRAAIGKGIPFTVHIAGRTGTRKTALAILAQRFWGTGFDYDRLPASWEGTANAIQTIAFTIKDALLVVDDFAPSGTSQDVARYHLGAGRVIRAQANAQGRSRLKANAGLQVMRQPRGLILSTGEDIPSEHSIMARNLVVPVEPGNIDLEKLTAAQHASAAGAHVAAMSAFVQWLAPRISDIWQRWKPERDKLRAEASGGNPHGRTPEIAAELGLALRIFVEFAVDVGVLSKEEATGRWHDWWVTLKELGEQQAHFLRSADPVDRYLQLLGSAIASGQAHVASREGDAPKPRAKTWGWRNGSGGKMHPSGARIGWVHGNDLYLEPTAAYDVAVKLSSNSAERLTVKEETLRQRLKERGLLVSHEEGRLTTRETLEGARRRVLHLKAEDVLEVVQDAPGQKQAACAA